MDAEVIKGMTYSGVGALMLGLTIWFVRALIKRSVTRADNEGSLDQRSTALVQTIQGVYDKIVDEQRETIKAQDGKIGALHDQLFTSYTRFGEIVGTQQQAISAEVSKVRDQHAAAMERVHLKLDACTSDHKQCQTEQSEIRGEVHALRQIVTNIQPVNLNFDQRERKKEGDKTA